MVDIVRLAVYNYLCVFILTRGGWLMEYMTIQEASLKWDISERRIQVLCTSGRLQGAQKFGRQWAIPADLEKPDDARIKSGRYKKNPVTANNEK